MPLALTGGCCGRSAAVGTERLYLLAKAPLLVVDPSTRWIDGLVRGGGPGPEEA
jgi:hypothetical protein